jgi:hypothetical protein
MLHIVAAGNGFYGGWTTVFYVEKGNGFAKCDYLIKKLVVFS